MHDGNIKFSRSWEYQVEIGQNADAVKVDVLAEGSLVTIVTAECAYLFRLIDANALRVKVLRGHGDLTNGMIGYLQGSSLSFGGTMRRAWLAIGYRAVFGSEDFPFMPAYVELAKTLDIAVNGTSITALDNGYCN